MKILVANIGSTSFKYRLYNMDDGAVLAQGRVERIGQPGGSCPNHQAAIRECLNSLAGDGKPLAKLESPGIAHETKSSFHFTVNGPGVSFDDVKIATAGKAKGAEREN